jgi:hypothetical protein
MNEMADEAMRYIAANFSDSDDMFVQRAFIQAKQNEKVVVDDKATTKLSKSAPCGVEVKSLQISLAVKSPQ